MKSLISELGQYPHTMLEIHARHMGNLHKARVFLELRELYAVNGLLYAEIVGTGGEGELG